MFVTDIGYSYPWRSKIMKLSMAGSNYQTLVEDKVRRPEGITVDAINERIYWADSLRDVIETADYHGDSR